MTVPYHTHNFEIPIAEKQDILAGTARDKVAVPASLGTAAAAAAEDFATKEQGVKADNAAPAARLIKAGSGLEGGGALTEDITLELAAEHIAALKAAAAQAASADRLAQNAADAVARAAQTADAAAKQAAAAGDVHKRDLGALAFKSKVPLEDIAASGALSAGTVLYGDGVWRQPPAGGSGGNGSSSGGGGDMRQALYDPRKKQADIFDMDNMAEGRANKILSSAERAKLAALPAEAVAAATQVQAGAGLEGGGQLSRSITLRLSEETLAALAQSKKAAQVTDLGILAFRDSISVADIITSGDREENGFLRADGTWAEPQLRLPAAMNLPAGMIAPFAGNRPPEGWLICDGSSVSCSSYAALFAAIGRLYGVPKDSGRFNLPDLRGEFIRGFDGGRGIDRDRLFASGQDDAMQEVKGAFSAAGSAPTTDVFTSASGVFALGTAHVRQRPMNRFCDVAGASAEMDMDISRCARTAAETRPRNVAMLYCIKF